MSDDDYPEFAQVLQTLDLGIIDDETCEEAINDSILGKITVEEEDEKDVFKPFSLPKTSFCTGPMIGGKQPCVVSFQNWGFFT